MNRLYPKHRTPSDHCKNALKYCPRPQEAQTSFDRSPKNKSGECRREFLNQTPSNLQKPLGDCAKSRRDIKSRETLCILEVSAPALGPQTHTHTCFCGSVCNYSLASGCFLISATTEEKIGEKYPPLSSQTRMLFAVQRRIHLQTILCDGSGKQSSPFQLRSSLVCTANEPRTRRPLSPVVSPLIAELFLITSSP